MASGDNRGSSGTSASLIRPMTALEETPPPIVVAGEVPDEGGSVVTVEPSGRQQQTAGDEHFPSIIVRLYGLVYSISKKSSIIFIFRKHFI